jgi:hypothetical protein
MICTTCGQVNRDEAAFCRTCGATLSAQITTCPQCGGHVEPGDEFCDSCGARLRAAAAVRESAPVQQPVQSPVRMSPPAAAPAPTPAPTPVRPALRDVEAVAPPPAQRVPWEAPAPQMAAGIAPSQTGLTAPAAPPITPEPEVEIEAPEGVADEPELHFSLRSLSRQDLLELAASVAIGLVIIVVIALLMPH